MRHLRATGALIGAVIGSWFVLGCAETRAPLDAARQPGAATRATVPDGPRRTALVEAFPGIRVRPGGGVVELDGEASLDEGWLEQIACGRRSREHESLVVVDARPSDLHAALLLAGFVSGAPGFWTYENQAYEFQPPRGDAVRISVRAPGRDGRITTRPISAWIRDHQDRADFPDAPWIFAGSSLEPAGEGPDAGERYVADMTGSVIGLVTFGDEVLGFSRVIADATEVEAPAWVVETEVVPPPGTPVTLVIERAGTRRVSGTDR